MCFLLVAISSRDLREQVTERLRQQYPGGLDAACIKIPSESWILYQFAPKHNLHAESLHYTGTVKLKNKVQLQTLRARHVDSHYCAALKKYIKQMGVLAATAIETHTREHEELACVSFFSVDDKAKVYTMGFIYVF